jgi:hypothetical protein
MRGPSFSRTVLSNALDSFVAAAVIAIVVAFIGGGNYSPELRIMLLTGGPLLLLAITAAWRSPMSAVSFDLSCCEGRSRWKATDRSSKQT